MWWQKEKVRIGQENTDSAYDRPEREGTKRMSVEHCSN